MVKKLPSLIYRFSKEGRYHRTLPAEPIYYYWQFFRWIWFSFWAWCILALIILTIYREFVIGYLIDEEDLVILNSGPWEVFFAIIGVIYAIIVGMLIVEAVRRHNNLNSIIEQEINAIEDIRDFLVYLDDDDEKRPAIKKCLRAYVNSVVNREWSVMRYMPGKKDCDTSSELYQLMSTVRKINPETNRLNRIIFESIISKVAEVTTYRTSRYMCAEDPIPNSLRALMQGLSVVIIIGLILYYLPWYLHYLIVFICTFALAALFELIIDSNHPFAERFWGINPQLFENLAERLGTIDVSCENFSEKSNFIDEIHVSVEENFQVKLYNPIAESLWSKMEIADQNIVIQRESPTFCESELGKPRQAVWTFSALKEGETFLSTEFKPSGKEAEKTQWTFALKVVVKPHI